MRPFRFSVIAERVGLRDEWITKVRRIEELGYSTLLVPDHLRLDMDPLVAMMCAADHSSLRVGSYVFCNDLRNPVMLVRAMTTLDVLSGGRVLFGLGCGYDPDDYSGTGIPFDEAGIRVSRFQEALDLIKLYFEKDEVSFSGKFYQVAGLKPNPMPVQKPHFPILVGASGKRMLQIAARQADIITIGGSGPETTPQKIAWIREAAGEQRFREIELGCPVFVVAVTDKPEYAVRYIAERMNIKQEEVLRRHSILIGTHQEIAKALIDRRERYGISSIEILETHMEAFAPVMKLLASETIETHVEALKLV